MKAYIPAIITASVAFIVGIGAQFLNNWLTLRREKKKYYREVYEKFISVYFMDVLLYIDVHTDPRVKHDVEQSIDISKVIDEMMKNIHFGDHKLQLAHLELKTRKHFYDPVGDLKERIEIKTCFYFLLYANTILKKIGLKLSPQMKFKFVYNIKAYGYWFLEAERNGYDKSLEKMVALKMSNNNALENFSLKYIAKLVEKWYLNDKKIDRFLKKVEEKNNILD